ncbi:DUF257 family protein [Thermococcus sp.]
MWVLIVGRGVGKILDKISPGETVLVEYEAYSSPELFLALLHAYSTQRGEVMLIDDVVDTFSEYIARLKLMGFDVDPLLSASVIKIGGSKEVGDVKGRLEVDKYWLDFKYYDLVYEKTISKEPALNPVLGIYKLFGLSSKHELIRLIRNIASFVGRGSRIAYYFINTSVAERLAPEMLPFLEEVSSSILRWSRDGSNYRLQVIKACEEELLGAKVVMEMREIKEGKL